VVVPAIVAASVATVVVPAQAIGAVIRMDSRATASSVAETAGVVATPLMASTLAVAMPAAATAVLAGLAALVAAPASGVAVAAAGPPGPAVVVAVHSVAVAAVAQVAAVAAVVADGAKENRT
jgi:hypothetical protein